MIIRIALVSGVALFAYVLVPAVSAAVASSRRLGLLTRLGKGIPCTLSDIADGKPVFKRDRPAGAESAEISFAPARASFLSLEKDGRIWSLRWAELSTILTGTTALLYPLGDDRYACLFHGELRSQDAEKAVNAAVLARVAPVRPDPVKAVSVAAGAFAEFAILLDALKRPDMDGIAVLALVAVFGKALPWCPPGLLLTLAAKSLPRRRRDTRAGTADKKSRRYGTVGFLLSGFAVALNVALILYVIAKVWIPVP